MCQMLFILIKGIKFINFANFMHYVILQKGSLYYNEKNDRKRLNFGERKETEHYE